MSRRTQSKEYKAVKTCKKKKSYSTFKDAGLANAFYFVNGAAPQTIYQCPICSNYHLTTRGFNA